MELTDTTDLESARLWFARSHPRAATTLVQFLWPEFRAPAPFGGKIENVYRYSLTLANSTSATVEDIATLEWWSRHHTTAKAKATNTKYTEANGATPERTGPPGHPVTR